MNDTETTQATDYRYGCDTDPRATKYLPAGYVLIDSTPGAWVIGYRSPIAAGAVARCKLTPLTPKSVPNQENTMSKPEPKSESVQNQENTMSKPEPKSQASDPTNPATAKPEPADQPTPKSEKAPKPTSKPEVRREEILVVAPHDLYVVGVDGKEGPSDLLYDERVKEPISPEMISSFRILGVLEPVIVVARGKKLAVVAGKKRVLGARIVVEEARNTGKASHCDTLAARLATVSDDEDKAAKHLISMLAAENLCRVEPPVLWKAARAAALKDRGMNPAKIAMSMGVTDQSIRDWLDLNGAVPEVKKAVKEERISATSAVHLGRLPTEKQGAALTKMLAPAKPAATGGSATVARASQPAKGASEPAKRPSAKAAAAAARNVKGQQQSTDAGPGMRMIGKLLKRYDDGLFPNLDKTFVEALRWVRGECRVENGTEDADSLDERVLRRFAGLTAAIRAIQTENENG